MGIFLKHRGRVPFNFKNGSSSGDSIECNRTIRHSWKCGWCRGHRAVRVVTFHGCLNDFDDFHRDITDRIFQEQEYSRLIDTANAPIFGVDDQMRVNIWNRKAAEITHYSITEVVGENLVDTFISPEYRPIVADVLSQALLGVETSNFGTLIDPVLSTTL